MEYRKLIILFIYILIDSYSCLSQGSLKQENNMPIYQPWYYEKSDTVYKVVYDSTVNSLNEIDYYIPYQGKWCAFYSNGNVKEKGDFKRRKKTIFFCLISKFDSKETYFKYRIKYKIWYYFDINGNLIKNEEFDNEGFKISN